MSWTFPKRNECVLWATRMLGCIPDKWMNQINLVRHCAHYFSKRKEKNALKGTLLYRVSHRKHYRNWTKLAKQMLLFIELYQYFIFSIHLLIIYIHSLSFIHSMNPMMLGLWENLYYTYTMNILCMLFWPLDSHYITPCCMCANKIHLRSEVYMII